jgi:DNA-binding NtrC family response regulator
MPDHIKKILVVDDEKSFLELIGGLLEAHQYEVQLAQSPQEAREVLDNFSPDLLISDWLMKDRVTGEELALESRERFPDLSVIIISGLPDISITDCDWMRFLPKPFRQNRLLELVEQANRFPPR